MLLIPQRVECLKIATGWSLESSTILSNCAIVLSSCQGIRTDSLFDLSDENSLLKKLIILLLFGVPTKIQSFLTVPKKPREAGVKSVIMSVKSMGCRDILS